MVALLRPITKAGFVVYVQGLELFWTRFSGINDTAETSTYPSGTGNRIYHVVGPRTVDDITLASPYDPELAREVEELWETYRCDPLTVVVQPVDCDGETNIGSPYILEGCLFSSLSVAEADRESGDVSEIELTFTVNSWRRS